MRPILWATLLIVWLSSNPARAQDLDGIAEVQDLLTGRWFEIEVIIFERLPVLDTNEKEQLALTRPRSFPNHMMTVDDAVWQIPDELLGAAPPPRDAVAVRQSIEAALLRSSDECIGFLRDVRQFGNRLRFGSSSNEDQIHPGLAVILDPQAFADPEEFDNQPQASGPVDPGIATNEPIVEPDIGAGSAIAPSPLLTFLADVAAYEDSLRSTGHVWLDPSEFMLTGSAKAINRQNDLRPIFHGRWRQAVPPRGRPAPIYFASAIDQRSPATSTGLARIEGTLDLTVARYLHFAPTLWYHADALGIDPIALPLTSGSQIDPATWADAYMELRESRRMRSGQLHYLDHPKIGLIVRIDPLPVPEDLNAAWNALRESGSKAQEPEQELLN